MILQTAERQAKYPLSSYFIRMNYIPYLELSRLMTGYYKHYQMAYNQAQINIYIDINSISRSVYVGGFDSTEHELSALLINLGMHYQRFFASIKKHANIFFIHSLGPDPTIVNLSQGTWVENTDQEKYPNEYKYFQRNIHMVKLLSEYIPNMYFIEGNTESAVLMCREISRNKAIPSLIHTRDYYTYLIPAEYSKLAAILYPMSKSYPQVLITHNNLIRYYLKQTKKMDMKDTSKTPIVDTLLSSNIGLLFAYNGLAQKHISSYMHTRKAIKYINDNMEKTGLFKDPNLPAHIKDREYIFNLTFIYQIYSNSADCISRKDYHIKLNDNNTLLQINEKYFKNYPLNLYMH